MQYTINSQVKLKHTAQTKELFQVEYHPLARREKLIFPDSGSTITMRALMTFSNKKFEW